MASILRHLTSILWAGILAAFFFGGCASVSESTDMAAANAKGTQAEQDAGYTLLRDVLVDERKVRQIFALKDASDPTRKLIEEISGLAETSLHQLDGLAKQKPTVRLNTPSLPPIEAKTRIAVYSKTTEELLEKEGQEFEMALLLTQVEALGYMSNLTVVLAQGEGNPHRIKFLNQLSQKSFKLREKVVKRIGTL
jgi:hypothetical protein